MCSERGMLVWSPSMLGDEEMDKYVHTAFDKYKYNREQALALLFLAQAQHGQGYARFGQRHTSSK